MLEHERREQFEKGWRAAQAGREATSLHLDAFRAGHKAWQEQGAPAAASLLDQAYSAFVRDTSIPANRSLGDGLTAASMRR